MKHMSTDCCSRFTSRSAWRCFTSGVVRSASLAAAAAASVLVPAISEAQEEPIPFFDDFESYSEWVLLPSPWQRVSENGHMVPVYDDNDLFGQGSSNLILNYTKNSTAGPNSLVLSNQFSIEVGRVSVDFVRPADGSTDELWFFLFVGSRHADNRAQYITIGGDAINDVEYDRGVLNQLELVFNNSDVAVFYDDEKLLAPGTVDIWLNGELKREGFSAHNRQRGPVTSLEFNSASARIHQFFFDNLKIEPVEFEIPEPVEAPEPQVILFENFASHTVGERPGEPWTTITEGSETIGSALIQKDTADLFGKGFDNQYMEYIAKGGGTAIVARSENTFSSDLITFSVRLINPTPETEPGYSWFIFNAGDVSGTTNRVQVITLDNRIDDAVPEGHSKVGNVPYPQNLPVQIDILINNKPLPVVYGNDHIIESGTADIWINGQLGRSGFSSSNMKLGPITSFELNIGSTNRQHLLIDEIVIYDSARVSGAPATGGFADWRTLHFPDDAENDEISGPAADPRGDGVPNLLKYALGLDPAVASREGLPVTETQNIEGIDYLTLSFDRPSDLDDVSYSVVATSDLTGWTDEAVLADTIDNGDGTVTEIWRDSQPLASSSARFLRLEVSMF